MNQRLPTEKGFRNNSYPDGPVDHGAPVLQVRGAEDKLLVVLFGYACHNTTTGVMEINGDYVGWVQEYLVPRTTYVRMSLRGWAGSLLIA